MILTHLSDAMLIAQIKTYDLLLEFGCKSRENVLIFRDDCIRELKRRDLIRE